MFRDISNLTGGFSLSLQLLPNTRQRFSPCQESIMLFFHVMMRKGRDWTKLIKPRGLSRLFIAFPLPLTFPWANQIGRRWCYTAWLMCVFGRHTRPCQVLVDLKPSRSSLGPLGSGIWDFNRSIVWVWNSPPALWQHSINFNLEQNVC